MGKEKEMKFRKKPVVIEAEQWSQENKANVMSFTKELGIKRTIYSLNPLIMYIDTLEGEMKANEGDWIIKGVKGEFYSCKPDIFEATYEPMEYSISHGEQNEA